MLSFLNYENVIEEEKQDEQTYEEKLNFFKQHRREQYETALKIQQLLKTNKNIIVYAEEKSGKRILKECSSLLDHNKYKVKHYYIVSLNRLDIKSQLEELRDYSIEAHIINNTNKATQVINSLRNSLIQNFKIVVHLDELDYGSGINQSLNVLIDFIDNNHIKLIKYSATPEEALYNQNKTKDAVLVNFEPSPDYRGSKWFLEKNFVKKVEPFIDYDDLIDNRLTFTKQGDDILKRLYQSSNKIGLLRLTGSHSKKSVYKMFKDLIIKTENEYRNSILKETLKVFNFIFIDKDSSLKWDNEIEVKKRMKGNNNVFVINQTCSRSTETCGYFKHYQSFYHDYRSNNDKKQYATKSQAYGRNKHYKFSMIEGRLQEIKWDGLLYIDPLVFEANCDRNKMKQIKCLASRIGKEKEKSFIGDFLQFSSFKKAVKYIRKNLNPNYKLEKNVIFRKINGYRTCNLRGIRRKYTLDEIIDDLNEGLGDIKHYRFNCCYDEMGDLQYIVRFKIGENINKDSYKHFTTKKSIYFREKN